MTPTSQTSDPYQRESPPLLVVISGPSGAGKDALVRRMKQRGQPFHFVVTATDRPPRRTEIHGRDYYFYSTEEFQRMIAAGEFLEHACVYGQLKGVRRADVRAALASGLDVVMRVDVQGAATVKGLVPGAVTIFLTCESEQELAARLKQRRTESVEELQKRLEVARREMSSICEFDYVVVNRRDRLGDAVDDVVAIIRAEHCRTMPRRVDV